MSALTDVTLERFNVKVTLPIRIIEDLTARSVTPRQEWSLGHNMTKSELIHAEKAVRGYDEVLLNIFLSALNMEYVDIEDTVSSDSKKQKMVLVAELWGWHGTSMVFPPRLLPLMLKGKSCVSAHLEYGRVFLRKYGNDNIPVLSTTPPMVTYSATLDGLVSLYADFAGVNGRAFPLPVGPPVNALMRYLRTNKIVPKTTRRNIGNYNKVTDEIDEFEKLKYEYPAHTLVNKLRKGYLPSLKLEFVASSRDEFGIVIRKRMKRKLRDGESSSSTSSMSESDSTSDSDSDSDTDTSS
jgi:hypothetical protein